MLKDHSAVTPVMLEPAAPRSRVKHSTTEPLRCPISKGYCDVCNKEVWIADSLLKPTVTQYNENTKYGQAYGRKNWVFYDIVAVSSFNFLQIVDSNNVF